MKIKQVLKKSPLVRKAFYTLLNYSPHSIIFRNNLKSVDEFDKKMAPILVEDYIGMK